MSQPDPRPAEADRHSQFVSQLNPRSSAPAPRDRRSKSIAVDTCDYFAHRIGLAGKVEPSALALLANGARRDIAKRGELLSQGDVVDHLYVVVSGWGCRHKSASDGARQILGFLVPGDVCNPEHLHGGRSSYAIGALTKMSVAAYRLDKIESAMARCDAITRLFWSDAVAISDRERNWLLNIGRRDALICVAHLLCEISERLDRMDLVQDGSFLFPITQYDIAAATGISAVHANRTMALLRQRRLIASKGQHLTIIDAPRLQEICLFESVA